MLCKKILFPGNRYLFYVKVDGTDIDYQFRANFMDIHVTTLRINKYTGPNTHGIYESGRHTYPTSWIVKIEDLTDILNQIDIYFPSEILLEIDRFV